MTSLRDELSAYIPSLHKMLSVITREDDGVVDDLVQTTLVTCLRDIDKFDASKATFKTWVHVIGRQVAMMYSRSRGSGSNIVELTASGDLTEEHDMPVEEEVIDVEASEKQQRLEALLHENIPKLTEPQRDVLNLYYVENKTDQEIADILGITRIGVTQRRLRALNRLRGLLSFRRGS